MVAVSVRTVAAPGPSLLGGSIHGSQRSVRHCAAVGDTMTAHPRPLLLVAVLALCVAAAIALCWPRREGITDQPTALSPEQIAATPDGILVQTAATEIRWWLAGDASRQSRWRELGAPVRNVLALSWVEGGAAGTRLDPFRGFGALAAAASPLRPTADDLAVAYDAIGAPGAAGVCREWEQNADADAGLDAKFRAARTQDDSSGKIRAYIRQHAAAIAAVRQR